MPRGWYLAQGLVPLGYSSSDDEEGPCELPNSRLVCGPHGLVSCGKCCTDYSFMDDILSDADGDEDDDEDEDEPSDGDGGGDSDADSIYLGGDHDVPAGTASRGGGNVLNPFSSLEKRRGTGKVFPSAFSAPASVTPTELFSRRQPFGWLFRYAHRDDPRALLIMTDGACLNNGQPNPRAGWAFVHGPGRDARSAPMTAAGRLESTGPFGDAGVQSSNRAELRAVIAALRFRVWTGEGFASLTIATDSEYVVLGATSWARAWIARGWRTAAGADVKNRDLWEMLLGECEMWHEKGLAVRFWRIPREWNTVADAAAKKAAEEPETPGQWMDAMGLPI